MKNLIAISGVLLITLLALLSCGGNEQGNTNSNDPDPVNPLEKENQSKLEKQKLDSINKALSAIQVRIYNHTPLYMDSDGFCMNESMGNKVMISEVKDFNNSKSYNCSDGNYIQKLSIEGTFKGINIRFLDDKTKVLKEIIKASNPFPTPIQYFALLNLAYDSSKNLTLLPSINKLLSKTSLKAD